MRYLYRACSYETAVHNIFNDMASQRTNTIQLENIRSCCKYVWCAKCLGFLACSCSQQMSSFNSTLDWDHCVFVSDLNGL